MRLVMVLAFLGVLLSLFALSILNKHVIMVLLCLESVTMNLYFMLVAVSGSLGVPYMSLIFMVFAVSEASLGLSLLISFARAAGNDYVFSKNLLVC